MSLIEVRTGSGFFEPDLHALQLALAAQHGDVIWRLVDASHTASRLADRLASLLAAMERKAGGRGLAPPWPLEQANGNPDPKPGVEDPADIVLVYLRFGDAQSITRPDTSHLISVFWQTGEGNATAGLSSVIGQRATAQAIISVTAPGGRGVARYRVATPTQFTFSWTHDVLMSKVQALVGRIVTRLLHGEPMEPPSGAEPSSAQTLEHGSKPVGLGDLVRYGASMAARLAGKVAKRLARQQQTWHLELSPGHWRDHLQGPRQLVPNPPGRFWADPFLWHRDGRDYLFVEDFDFARGLAHLSALEIDDQGQVHELGECLREDFHLSFPFLFEWQGQLHMCPETFAAGQIRVYRCDEFPLKWSPVAVLMDKVSAADTVLLQHGDRWWMLTNIDSAGGSEHCTELHIFWADSPLSTHWTPHPANPVYWDAGRARNGGLIRDGQQVFRVNQVQRYGIYGAALAVNELIELNPTRFSEKTVAGLDPQASGSAQLGAHHLSSNGRWSVSDHLQYEPQSR